MLTEAKIEEASSTPSFFCKFLSILSPKKHEKAPDSWSTPANKSSNMFDRVFRYFDENGDGKISSAELRNCMRNAGEELSVEDAEAVVASTDSDGDGFLEFEDFAKLVETEGDEEEKGRSLREAFGVYEMKGRDCITPESLRRALRLQLGESNSIEECQAMIRRFDLDGDGVISFDEFRVMMI